MIEEKGIKETNIKYTTIHKDTYPFAGNSNDLSDEINKLGFLL